MNTTADLLTYLGANGISIRNDSTGAIQLPNGDTAFVWERTKDGQQKVTVKHPPKGGRAQSYYQTFTSRERALKGILSHRKIGA